MIETLIKMMDYKGYIIQSSHGMHFTTKITAVGDEIMIESPLYITSPSYDKNNIRMSPEFLAGTDISSLTTTYNWVKHEGQLIITYVYEIAGIKSDSILTKYTGMTNNLPPA